MHFVVVSIASRVCCGEFNGSVIACFAESRALSMQSEKESSLQAATARVGLATDVTAIIEIDSITAKAQRICASIFTIESDYEFSLQTSKANNDSAPVSSMSICPGEHCKASVAVLPEMSEIEN